MSTTNYATHPNYPNYESYYQHAKKQQQEQLQNIQTQLNKYPIPFNTLPKTDQQKANQLLEQYHLIKNTPINPLNYYKDIQLQPLDNDTINKLSKKDKLTYYHTVIQYLTANYKNLSKEQQANLKQAQQHYYNIEQTIPSDQPLKQTYTINTSIEHQLIQPIKKLHYKLKLNYNPSTQTLTITQEPTIEILPESNKTPQPYNPELYQYFLGNQRILTHTPPAQSLKTQQRKVKQHSIPKNKTKPRQTHEQILNELRGTYPDILKENQWIPYSPTQLDSKAYFFTVEEINPHEETYKARQIILDQIKETPDFHTQQQLWNEFHQTKITNTWQFNQIPFRQLDEHPVKNAQIINNTTGTTVSKAVELYREALIKNGITDKNKTIMTIAWSKILVTIYLCNQRHINFITSNGSYNHKQIQTTHDHTQTSIQYYLNKPIRNLTDKAKDFIELYATRVDYNTPEPTTYNYKEPVQVPANCFMEYTIEEKTDDYFIYHKTKFTDQERKTSPKNYIKGKRRVAIKTELEEVYDLESILWLENHKDQLADLDGEYKLRKLYDTFKTLEEYLAKFEHAERMIDLRPAPTTVEELRQHQYEDEVIALHDPEYFWENTTYVPEASIEDMDDLDYNMDLYEQDPELEDEEDEDILFDEDQPLED